MTYREHVQWMKKQWIGSFVRFEGAYYVVVDVDYNCGLLIDKKAEFTETTAVDPSMVERVEIAKIVHGHWISAEEAIEKGDYNRFAFTCSVCGHLDWDCTESTSFKYCPHCGARMDGSWR